ncbi:uncharacterized protein EHS24_007575 [Apiotrichum porosum]|uniref:Uncharacterized protein n=1 Tax=Apiotrichum porosum TaxID=105984 RepID=A0A427XV27_9TREE|nr:uncharacterized protein EHS24_007575 [Apiotrichum porosum]RSH82591.1 hypothetical protein EHS24_007575 [Apiotrichum porosum]
MPPRRTPTPRALPRLSRISRAGLGVLRVEELKFLLEEAKIDIPLGNKAQLVKLVFVNEGICIPTAMRPLTKPPHVPQATVEEVLSRLTKAEAKIDATTDRVGQAETKIGRIQEGQSGAKAQPRRLRAAPQPSPNPPSKRVPPSKLPRPIRQVFAPRPEARPTPVRSPSTRGTVTL